MSAEGVNAAIHKIADDMIALCATILEDDNVGVNAKVGKNTLRDSILKNELALSIGQTVGQDSVINALFNHYVVYLEWDRPPKHGKRPPIAVLKEWAAKAGIPTDVDTLWKISNAIWRDGHKGRPIFATIDTELDGLFYNNWADQLRDALFDTLDAFFND